MTDFSSLPTFKPSKRRKVARSISSTETEALSEHFTPIDTSDNESSAVVRRATKPRARVGLAVQAEQTYGPNQDDADTTQNPQAALTPLTVGKQFAISTGLIKTDLDKHMMAYVDSHMKQAGDQDSPAPTSADEMVASSDVKPNKSLHASSRPTAGNGVLEEVDLTSGSHRPSGRVPAPAHVLAHGTSMAINGAAIVESLAVESAMAMNQLLSQSQSQPHKRRRRGPAPKTAEDLAREAMVEKVLSESTHAGDSLYSVVKSGNAQSGKGDIARDDGRAELEDDTELDGQTMRGADVAADEKLARQFRQDYYDSLPGRRRQAVPKRVAAKTKVEPARKSRGPRLGGSRSVRAAIYHAGKKKKENDLMSKK